MERKNPRERFPGMLQSPPMLHRYCRLILMLFVGVVALSTRPPGSLAEDRPWEQLEPEVERLYQEQRYAQLTAIADEALRAAEHTFGRNDPKVAALLINLSHAHRAVALNAIADYGRQ